MATLFLAYNSFAQDSPQWHLPEGATARLGKGWLYEIQYSPDGTRLAAAGALGIWIYDTATDEEIDLFPADGSAVSALAYAPGWNDARWRRNGRDHPSLGPANRGRATFP